MASKTHYSRSEQHTVDVPERWLHFLEGDSGKQAKYGGDGCNTPYLQGKTLLEVLLYDHTTGKNIVWGTDSYGFDKESEILPEQICGERNTIVFSDMRDILIRPRVAKNMDEQRLRTKEKAEVFTPSWICNKQLNMVDNAWFGWNPDEHDGWSIFNRELDESHTWEVNPNINIDHSTFLRYINNIRLEITCGEGPYLVCRYDTTTAKFFDNLDERIGILDRKMRLINLYENDRSNWLKDVKKAYKSCYGFEWQGDNLLLAREAMLYSFIEYYRAKWGTSPKSNTLMIIAEIISWNVWQMDGLTFKVPYTEQLATIKDWQAKDEEQSIITFQSIADKNE